MTNKYLTITLTKNNYVAVLEEFCEAASLRVKVLAPDGKTILFEGYFTPTNNKEETTKARKALAKKANQTPKKSQPTPEEIEELLKM